MLYLYITISGACGSYQNTRHDPMRNVVAARGAAMRRCATVWLLAGFSSILGIRCWSVWRGGHASIIHYNTRRALLDSYFSFF